MTHVLLTLILRDDGLELVESTITTMDMRPLRQQARQLAKRLRQQHTSYTSKNKVSVDSDIGPYSLLFVVSGALTFVAACERKYPKKLALMYLEEIEREFTQSFPAPRIAGMSTPFACQAFETFINKSKSLYEDTTAQHDVGEMAKVQSELSDVHRILSQNVQDIIDRGVKMESVAMKSEDLFAESLKFQTQAHDLRLRQIWRKYGTYAGVSIGVLLILFVRFYLFA